MTIYGSELCPHCKECLKFFNNKNVQFEFKSITSSLEILKEFLKIREDKKFEQIKNNGSIGIPVIRLEDEDIVFDWDSIIERL